jgi:hypothetical protein
MTINLAIYDFFSYFIPGLLYLSVANEFLRVLGWKYVNFVSLSQSGYTLNIIVLVPIIIISYILGHLLDGIANRFFYGLVDRLRRQPPMYANALRILKERHPQLSIKFDPMDWAVLFTLIRQRNSEMAHSIDRDQAYSIMLRNISFGCLLLALIQAGAYVASSQQALLLNCLAAFLISSLAFWKSAEFRLWFFLDIFEASLEYGSSLKDVVEHNYKKTTRGRRIVAVKHPKP